MCIKHQKYIIQSTSIYLRVLNKQRATNVRGVQNLDKVHPNKQYVNQIGTPK